MTKLIRAIGFVLLAGFVLPCPVRGAQPPALPKSLYDPALAEVRLASVAWQAREGKPRQVVDVVCLVPDLPTYLEAIGTWDADHFFPVLFDDVETSLRFLRAFRPARVVRMPSRAGGSSTRSDWDAATQAVGRSWRARSDDPAPAGDRPPPGREPGTPGVVVSNPDSSTLAGAVALAAGRFQPLLRGELPRGYADRLKKADMVTLAEELRGKVGALFPKVERLGDDCDFVTLAGDYPYHYEETEGRYPGLNSVDDRLGFVGLSRRRWAYTGRLLGDPATSAYQAMCSLFLQPKTAGLVHTYEEKGDYDLYEMSGAVRRLAPRLKVTLKTGADGASLAGWESFFFPTQRSDLLLINSNGSAIAFGVRGGQGTLRDVPHGVPAILHQIHSYSAQDPKNVETLAGRWLAGGAYVYFGATDEPFLQSFRPPTLLADLIVEGLPLASAIRQGSGEPFGFPWKLVYLGDPLCRVLPAREIRPRVAWPTVASWPTYAVGPAPTSGDDARLAWALKTGMVRAARGETPDRAWVDTLLTIRRDRVRPASRAILDALTADAVDLGPKAADLRARLEAIPEAERTIAARRLLERPPSVAKRRPAP